MNKVFLFCCVLLSTSCQADSWQVASILTEVEGIWEGTGKQDDGSNWPVKITINSDNYLVEYPSLNCGGSLKLLRENDESLVFQEVLNYGFDACHNDGKTVLIKAKNDHNTLRYQWYHKNGGKAAVGELKRTTTF
jgi:hypothetical protein